MSAASRGLNLTQQVTESLGSAIVGGKYNAQNPVPSEAIICEELDVSRSAAREAVKSLAAKGLITSRARQGIRILPESEWNLFDADVLRWMRDSNPSLFLLKEFAELRVAIEPEASRLAAKRQNKDKIGLIAEALDKMRLAEEGLQDPLEADIAFHLSILDASENRFFTQLGRIIDTTLRVSIRFTNQQTGVTGGVYADHKKIYDGIVAGDEEEAARQSGILIGAALQTINDALKLRTA